jgi:transposase
MAAERLLMRQIRRLRRGCRLINDRCPTGHGYSELRRPGVTLSLLWDEYRSGAAEGFGYSWFCDLYRAWIGRLQPVMQTHIAGEKLFVDYAGDTMEVFDGCTGEVLTVQIFVAVMGASNYLYAEATSTQTLPDWIGSHVRAFAYFMGVTRRVPSCW